MNDLNLFFKKEIKKIMNYFNAGKYDVVITKSKILLKKNPEFMVLYNIIGISLQKINRYEEAKNIFLQGLKINSNSLDLILNLANIYKAEKKYNFINVKNNKDLSKISMCVDYPKDLMLSKKIFSPYKYKMKIKNWKNYIKFFQ